MLPIFDCQRDNSAVLLIDMQERFEPAIPSIGAQAPVGRACERLLRGAGELGLPTMVTRQYPKGLGDTMPQLRAAAREATVCDKTHFSCLHDQAIKQTLAEFDREWLVVAGIEAHVCVLGTVADALRHGYRVIVCGDAVDSRAAADAKAAKAAMRDLGALVLPVESVLFRCLGQAGGDAFKAISRLVR